MIEKKVVKFVSVFFFIFFPFVPAIISLGLANGSSLVHFYESWVLPSDLGINLFMLLAEMFSFVVTALLAVDFAFSVGYVLNSVLIHVFYKRVRLWSPEQASIKGFIWV